MWYNYLKVWARNLIKNKTYNFLNIAGLAIGITCAGMIFLWVENEFSYNHQHLKKDRLFQVMENQHFESKTYTFSATPGLLGPAIIAEIPGVLNSCRLTWSETPLFSLGEKAIYEKGQYGDPSLLTMFTIPFIAGSPQNSLAQTNSIVISEKMARQFFQTTDVVGKTLQINKGRPAIITGVFKNFPSNSTLQFDWLAPFEKYLADNDWLKSWGSNSVMSFVELDKNVPEKVINQKLLNFIQGKDPQASAHAFLLPLKDWRLRNHFVEGKQDGGRIETVHLFSTIAWIILLIACINFMNLATARSEKRAKEVGMRKVLGAERRLLILQFLFEAFLMSFIAVLVAVLLMVVVLPYFNSVVEGNLSLRLFEATHVAALLGIILVCGLVAGSYPAFYLSSFQPIKVLKGFKSKVKSAVVIREGLVILQFAIAILLMIATLLIYQQIKHIKSRDIGYNKEQLIQLPVNGNLGAHFDYVKENLIKQGVIENAAMSGSDLLTMGTSSDGFSWEGKDPDKKILITVDPVSPGFLTTTGLKMLEGRSFFPQAKQDSLHVIVNASFARMLGGNVIGKLLRYDSLVYEVIGVVNDFVYGNMYGKSDPLLFTCTSMPGNFIYLKLKSDRNIDNNLAAVSSYLQKENPGYPFEYHFLDDQFDQMFKSEQLIGRLSRIFTILTIFISCLGLFGLAAYTAESRKKEIGIRKVLGATVLGISRLLSMNFLKLIGISALIAFPLSWWLMNKWLQNYDYRIKINPLVLVFAAFLSALIAVLTIGSQAIRSASEKPATIIRSE